MGTWQSLAQSRSLWDAHRAISTEHGPAWEMGYEGMGMEVQPVLLSLDPKVAGSVTQGHLSLLPPAVALLNHPMWHGAGFFPTSGQLLLLGSSSLSSAATRF